MSIFRYTCFISLSRAGNCDAQARGNEISCRTQAMGFPAGPRQWDFLQGAGKGISCRRRNSQHDWIKCNKYNEVLTFCSRVVKSEVHRRHRSRNIVSDMNAKCQYYVRRVLNHDFVDDFLMSREENREVSRRPSCALTSHMTSMQNIIIPLDQVLFEWIMRSVVRCVVRCVVKRHESNCEAPCIKHKCNIALLQSGKWCFVNHDVSSWCNVACQF